MRQHVGNQERRRNPKKGFKNSDFGRSSISLQVFYNERATIRSFLHRRGDSSITPRIDTSIATVRQSRPININ